MIVEELIVWLSNFPKDKTVYIPYGGMWWYKFKIKKNKFL